VGVVLRHVRVRGAMYVLALLVVSGVIGMQARYSWALRGHDEKAGSYGVAKSVGALAGQQRGVFLWQQGKCCGSIDLLFGSSTWIISHNDSAVLPNDATKWGAYVAKIIAAVPSQPVFVVLNATTPAPSSSTMSYAAVSRLTGSLPVWEESNIHRPQRAYAYPYDFIVYSVSPKG